MLMTTGSVGGQSIVRPVAGLYNYSEIHAFLKRTIYATPLTKEGAKVAVLNGSGRSGLAQAEADRLSDKGLEVVLIDNAPAGEYGAYTVYRLNSGIETMVLAQAELEQLYSVSVQGPAGAPSLPVEADFVVVVGSGATDAQ